MTTKDVSIGFSDRKLHNLMNRLLPVLLPLSYILPFAALLYVDLTGRFTFLIPIALAFLAINLLAVPVWVWYKFVRFFGFPSMKDCRKMLELDAMKASVKNPQQEKGGITDVIIVILVIAQFFYLAWRGTGYSVFLYPAVYSLCVAVKGPLRRSRPPAVLLLGGSSYDATRLQLQLVSIFGSSLVMSGLFHKQSATVKVTGIFSDFNSVRTANYSKWQEMIFSVLQLSRIVIIDIRNITDAVHYEIELATNLLNPERVFYIGQAVDPVPPGRCFEEAGLMNELRMKYSPQKAAHLKTPTVYEDKRNGYFRFTPPPGWVRSEEKDARTKVAFTPRTNPDVTLRFIVKDAPSSDFASLILHQKKAIREAETGLGAHCQMEVAEFVGRQTIITQVIAPNGEIVLNRLFQTGGLDFNITYSAPSRSAFDTYRSEADRSLESIEILHRPAATLVDGRERIEQQEIAHQLRLAELSADVLDINKANGIVSGLLRKYPNNKEIQKMAEDLEKISRGEK